MNALKISCAIFVPVIHISFLYPSLSVPFNSLLFCISGIGDGLSDRPKGILDKVSPAATTSNLKKRIPTKDNPPPELAKWLETFQVS